ncbi:IS3 family transposase [Glutamicibacter sp. TV12E]|uniref:IS3 family transposase n=1 Tax=Glutamicibacter sp. TV12E TaxID=3446362 RepID=UPI0040347EC1
MVSQGGLSGKTPRLEGSGASVKTQAILTLKSEHDLIDLLAVAGLARSTYYYHLKRLEQPDPHAELKAAITASFEDSKRRYGYRKVHLELRAQGWNVGRKLVRKLMRLLGFQSKARPKRRYNSYRGNRGRSLKTCLPGTSTWIPRTLFTSAT